MATLALRLEQVPIGHERSRELSVRAGNGPGEDIGMDRGEAVGRREPGEPLLHALAPDLGPLPRFLAKGFAKPERVIDGCLKDGTGHGVILVGERAETETG